MFAKLFGENRLDVTFVQRRDAVSAESKHRAQTLSRPSVAPKPGEMARGQSMFILKTLVRVVSSV
jgi:hypothetical protein